jgi:hypothetical protein
MYSPNRNPSELYYERHTLQRQEARNTRLARRQRAVRSIESPRVNRLRTVLARAALVHSIGWTEDEGGSYATHRASDPSGVHAGGRTDVEQLTGAWEVARTLLVVAHPSEEGWAERFIDDSRRAIEAGESVSFAVVLREVSQLVGDVLLKLNPRDDNGETWPTSWAYLTGDRGTPLRP